MWRWARGKLIVGQPNWLGRRSHGFDARVDREILKEKEVPTNYIISYLSRALVF